MEQIHIFRRESGALVGEGFVMAAPAKTGGVVPSEGPLMRRRSVMAEGRRLTDKFAGRSAVFNEALPKRSVAKSRRR